MYSREEASRLRQEFFTALGEYMSPILSADNEKVNWLNYKTGEKHLFFRMSTSNRDASIGILLTHPDPEIQAFYFDTFLSLKSVFEGEIAKDWLWQLHTIDENGKIVSRIYTKIEGVSVLRREDWPALISFFKPRLIALDSFWTLVKYQFEALR
ncbi:DUF4268 domain-containing protein [Flavihumibacter rivuli]|uniref:DUF4268 domain-containing protein n=1 Tax=Flavihumibacter rivuli TaxID=2838156 RepID=UPI001BDE32D9|nr:DUF4268 domain-containing protein [Flavihumibacter rivuli]ULQ57378.1 DUF4268 domain-containing protein [Flavihumibacter rivuli]